MKSRFREKFNYICFSELNLPRLLLIHKSHNLKLIIKGLAVFLLLNAGQIIAQVQVSKEPMHRPVFTNQYIRVLDVVLPPKDTTQFHIHSTPSLFLVFTNSRYSAQVENQEWIETNVSAGQSWYSSFFPDSVIHRVANLDSFAFHVIDIEILSSYDSNEKDHAPNLPLPVLYNNERATAYQIHHEHINGKAFKSKTPMLAALVTGDKVMYQNHLSNQLKEIYAGQFVYIEPETSFNLTPTSSQDMKMVIFEIK